MKYSQPKFRLHRTRRSASVRNVRAVSFLEKVTSSRNFFLIPLLRAHALCQFAARSFTSDRANVGDTRDVSARECWNFLEVCRNIWLIMRIV